ncbi:hypothetical protein A3A49_02500 [Candidatus Curtissbacteria bacterium RIFCSPLOWO2_01_FULL_38_11b]|uniref:Uncharacterized protein n=1 Tax=Candidatus Curtissbacteria bacterium RIFCSPLOWO2_01_FULL_38_11b TaxID=1797725 RepID=A0A1F5GYL8_9BACT|nr:MAG: hypothetical protein A3A49_02500 [Candidatus Curtissbacteria bacterium RIFCSPLOWO2_01_FULL_38_11b]
MEADSIDKIDVKDQNTPQVELKQRPVEPITQPLNKKSSSLKLNKVVPLIFILLIIAAGAVSGLYLSSTGKNGESKSAFSQEEELTPQIQQSFTQTFRDEAEGEIEKNDALDKYAQGTHKLIRPGGEDQTAYLTSSVLDLDEYVSKKVKVFGETFGSSQVGWLMDVGKVEVIQ